MSEHNIFLAWSGQSSKLVAQALHNWLPKVIQSAKPWMSEEGIRAGSVWHSKLLEVLRDIKIGVLCVTPGNLNAPWLYFEGGMIAKTIAGTEFVCPYLLGVSSTDVPSGPLSPFQSCIADENGTLKLVKDINKALNSPTDEGNLEETFKLFWNKLQAQLGEAKDTTDFKSQAPKRTAEEMSEEILAAVRELSRNSDQTRDSINKILGDFIELKVDAAFAKRWDTQGTRVGSLLYELERSASILSGHPNPTNGVTTDATQSEAANEKR
jgi:hypothetical protein